MAKRSTTIWVIVGIVAALVVLGIVGVVAVPRIWGAQGFCDESTGVRLTLVGELQGTETPEERAEVTVSVAQDTADDLQDQVGRVRWPTDAQDQAQEVADAWSAVAEVDATDVAAVQEAGGRYNELDTTFQDEHCGGVPTGEDFEG